MKSKFLNFPAFLFLTTLFFFFAASYLSYINPTYNYFVSLGIVSSIFVFQLLIVLSDFTIKTRRILWSVSYLFGFSLVINFNKELFLLSWKYQLIIFVFVLYLIFSLRFISNVNKWILLLMFFNNFFFCGYLLFVVTYSFEDAIYFDIAKWLSVYMISFSALISFAGKKPKMKIEVEKE